VATMLTAVPSAESMHPRPEPDLAVPERAGIKIHDWCVVVPETCRIQSTFALLGICPSVSDDEAVLDGSQPPTVVTEVSPRLARSF